MGTTSEELKKLYAKLGGKDPKVAGFSAPGEILNAINEIPLPTEYELPTVTTEDTGDVLVVNEEGKWDKGEAGGGLPEVTTDDNGKILQVVEGLWNKAAMSKDVEVFYVETNSSRLTLKNQKKLSDIADACDAEKLVLLQNTSKQIYIVYECNRFNNAVTITAVCFYIASGTRDIYMDIFSDFMVSKNYDYITHKVSADLNHRILPEVSSSDSGKTLTVNSGGYWVTSNPPASLPEVTTDDNGDVLTVVDGAWAKAEPVGTQNVSIFEASLNDSAGTITITLSGDKKISDIVSDITGGKYVVIHAENEYYTLSAYSSSSTNGYVMFSKFNVTLDGTKVFFISVSSYPINLNDNKLKGTRVLFTP